MSDRSAFLARVKEALRYPAPAPHPDPVSFAPVESRTDCRAWLPVVGPTGQEQFRLFQENAHLLKAELIVYRGLPDLQSKLGRQAKQEKWRKVATHAGFWSGAAVEPLFPVIVSSAGKDSVRGIESSDVGITECDALIAQTGSVLVTSRSAGGRLLSILPPHHVILARGDQMVPDLEAAFALLRRSYADDWPSFISFITGPSRTGDIERILVLGAHGPKRLTIYCEEPL